MNHKPTIAIVGASYLQLPLVEKAKQLGLRTICFAWKDGAVCADVADQFYPISIIEKEQILEVCKKEKIDGITTIATDVAVPTIAFVANALGLIGNSPTSAYLSTNKYVMRQAFASAGVHCPRFAKVTSLTDAKEALSIIGLPAIVKPCDRSGSMGVTRIDEAAQLPEAVASALEASFAKEAVLEQFVDIAQEISVEGISWKGEHHILAITDKVTTGAPHYVELGQHQPSQLPRDIFDEAVRQARLGVRTLGIQYGASHPELMISRTGEVFVTEIGARMGGDFIGSDLVYLSTGYDFLQGVLEVALGHFTPPVQRWQKSAERGSCGIPLRPIGGGRKNHGTETHPLERVPASARSIGGARPSAPSCYPARMPSQCAYVLHSSEGLGHPNETH